MYTLFHNAHTHGDTVMRALAWEFPNDPNLASADRQFLLGPALMVTPVLTPGATTVDGVFPGMGKGGEVWYDWYNQSEITQGANGANVTIDAPLGHIPVYLRGGYILPLQEPAMTTREARQTDWALIVALNQSGQAEGMLYIDDGESLVQNSTLDVRVTADRGALSAVVKGSYGDRNPLANVTILGVGERVSGVMFNGRRVGEEMIGYNEEKKVLTVTGLQVFTREGAWRGNWTLEGVR